MKKLLAIISLLIVFILISGCTKKEPQIIYKEAPYYEFQTVDFKNAYIESKPNTKYKLNQLQVMEICKPLLQDINTIYKETKSFYDEQIKDYQRINKESK